jgi:hypothetical protein
VNLLDFDQKVKEGWKMKLSQHEVETMIADTIDKICNVKVEDREQHLLSEGIPVSVVDYLYVLDALEDKLKLPIAEILEKNNYEVFTIRNLAEKICSFY